MILAEISAVHKLEDYKSRNHFFPAFVRNQIKMTMQMTATSENNMMSGPKFNSKCSISSYLLFYNP